MKRDLLPTHAIPFLSYLVLVPIIVLFWNGFEARFIFAADLLTVSPGEEVRFPTDLPNARIPITLNNINAGPVAFKV